MLSGVQFPFDNVCLIILKHFTLIVKNQDKDPFFPGLSFSSILTYTSFSVNPLMPGDRSLTFFSFKYNAYGQSQ